jgi:hypothetical protein
MNEWIAIQGSERQWRKLAEEALAFVLGTAIP